MAAPGSKTYRLLSVLQEYAPDASAQQLCAEVIQRMEANAEPEDVQVQQLAGALTDGLSCGNWPWKVMNPESEQWR